MHLTHITAFAGFVCYAAAKPQPPGVVYPPIVVGPGPPVGPVPAQVAEAEDSTIPSPTSTPPLIIPPPITRPTVGPPLISPTSHPHIPIVPLPPKVARSDDPTVRIPDPPQVADIDESLAGELPEILNEVIAAQEEEEEDDDDDDDDNDNDDEDGDEDDDEEEKPVTRSSTVSKTGEVTTFLPSETLASILGERGVADDDDKNHTTFTILPIYPTRPGGPRPTSKSRLPGPGGDDEEDDEDIRDDKSYFSLWPGSGKPTTITSISTVPTHDAVPTSVASTSTKTSSQDDDDDDEYVTTVTLEPTTTVWVDPADETLTTTTTTIVWVTATGKESTTKEGRVTTSPTDQPASTFVTSTKTN